MNAARGQRRLIAAAGALCAFPAAGAELPAGTRVHVRLTQHVYSHAVKPGQAVDTLVIAPVRVGEQVVVAPGWQLEGTVLESGTLPGREKRARLRLGFTKLVDESGTAFPVDARVVEVDGAREALDAQGRMIGVAPQKGLPRDQDALLRLGVQLDPVALGLMEASGQTVRAAVGYDRGSEMTVELTSAATVTAAPAGGGPKEIAPAELKALVGALPARNAGGEPLNLLLGGTREQVEAAFQEAGFQPMEKLWAKAGPRAFLALAEKHGFRPPALAQLDGLNAALAFEKQNNTLARRHRVRLWPRAEIVRGQPVWLGAAVRCVDLVFDRTAGAFRHRLDAATDAEREKVVQDLVSARRVSARALADRKDAPRTTPATAADRLETDGRLAVVLLK